MVITFLTGLISLLPKNAFSLSRGLSGSLSVGVLNVESAVLNLSGVLSVIGHLKVVVFVLFYDKIKVLSYLLRSSYAALDCTLLSSCAVSCFSNCQIQSETSHATWADLSGLSRYKMRLMDKILTS